MRRTIVLLTILIILLTILAPAALAAPDQAFPKILPLPDGFAPEGVAVGRGTTFYVGSLAGGAVYRGDLRTGEGDVFVQPKGGRAIAGIYVDQRANTLFASGALSGSAYVFDAQSGAERTSYQLAAGGPAFINDVIVTRDAAYFTNSFAAEIYRVPLGPGGSLPNQSQVQTIPLTGAWVQIPGAFVFNANGIEATSDGRWLLIVNSTTGTLYRVDPQTGSATGVDLGAASLTAGDGLRLQGKTLFVVRNQLNQIAVVKLAPDYASGTVERTITDPAFEVPTTVALFGSRLYAVNARFGLPPGPFNVVQMPRN